MGDREDWGEGNIKRTEAGEREREKNQVCRGPFLPSPKGASAEERAHTQLRLVTGIDKVSVLLLPITPFTDLPPTPPF